ncbi:nuclear transport factor 2 family protein [Xanthomonas codiaei]|uniref:Ketosteroid isomerase n=1 Tax=Xanthomonas codiaei TaxID=56463 RepID=A0A2S7CD69_9XANT|nr:nuclear transport factor 2 family protein [Xanthomonas codiaei]PPU59451.1 ketosteroid isomerase [Xanthomonas codiaei]
MHVSGYALLWVAAALLAQVVAAAPAGMAAGTDCAEATTPTERNRCIVDGAFRQWASGGRGFFDRVLAPEVVWTIEGSGPHAGTLHGREALMARAVQPLASRLSTPLRPLQWQVWADGAHVIVQWEGAGRVRDGGEYRNRYAWIMRMHEGKAVQVNAFLDLPRYGEALQGGPAQVAGGAGT